MLTCFKDITIKLDQPVVPSWFDTFDNLCVILLRVDSSRLRTKYLIRIFLHSDLGCFILVFPLFFEQRMYAHRKGVALKREI